MGQKNEVFGTLIINDAWIISFIKKADALSTDYKGWATGIPKHDVLIENKLVANCKFYCNFFI